MQDSSGLGGGREDPAQLSFDPKRAPLLSRNSRVGSANGLGMPKLLKLGPSPRITMSVLVPVPRMNPPILTSLAVPTWSRVEILASWDGPGDGVVVGVGVAVGPGIDEPYLPPVFVSEGVTSTSGGLDKGRSAIWPDPPQTIISLPV